jgi:putative ABC transport system permease protein
VERLLRWIWRMYPSSFRRRWLAEMERDLDLRTAARRRVGPGLVAEALLTLVRAWTRSALRAVTTEWLASGLWQDLRIAARTLRRSPAFFGAAVVVLAVGIGANATVFSALRAAILADPPYPELNRLVLVDRALTLEAGGPSEPAMWSYRKLGALRAMEGRLVDPIVGYARRLVTLSEAGPATPLWIELVSPGYFGILGMDPPLGRGFTADEDSPADPPLVAVISHRLWTERFQGAQDVVGRDIVLNGVRLRVVGVAPPGFAGLGGDADAWAPATASAPLIHPFLVDEAQGHWMWAVGRLAPGASFEDAQAQMRALGDAVAESFPEIRPGATSSAMIRSFEEVRVNRDARAAVLLLGVAAALVLLVACANLSGLLLTRARRRARDGAVRLALGASRWRLLRASLAESALLAGSGGAAGLILAGQGTRAMAAAWPTQFLGSASGELRVVSVDALGVDGHVLSFAVAATLLTTLLFGLAPALRASATGAAVKLRAGGALGGGGGRAGSVDLRTALVGGQVALALVLLIGAALVGASMKRLLDIDPGFDPSGVVTLDYGLPRESAWNDDLVGFHAEALERLAALAGVRDASTGRPPYSGHWALTAVHEVEGQPPFAEEQRPSMGVNVVSPAYFGVHGIRVVAGRALDERDGDDARPTVVINRRAAETLFPDREAVGRRVRLGVRPEGTEEMAEIVGVVADARYAPPDQEVIPEAYYAYRDFPVSGGMISLKVDGDPHEVVPAVRSALARLDPAMPIYDVRTMDERVAAATGDRRVVLALLALFSVFTVVLAAIGTWGVVAQAVAERQRELGLRLALGAGDGSVVTMVLRQSLAAAALGVSFGLAASSLVSRLLEAFLFETSARDPGAFAAAAAFLVGVVLLASYLPARRATRVDPAEALRAD